MEPNYIRKKIKFIFLIEFMGTLILTNRQPPKSLRASHEKNFGAGALIRNYQTIPNKTRWERTTKQSARESSLLDTRTARRPPPKMSTSNFWSSCIASSPAVRTPSLIKLFSNVCSCPVSTDHQWDSHALFATCSSTTKIRRSASWSAPSPTMSVFSRSPR